MCWLQLLNAKVDNVLVISCWTLEWTICCTWSLQVRNDRVDSVLVTTPQRYVDNVLVISAQR